MRLPLSLSKKKSPLDSSKSNSQSSISNSSTKASVDHSTNEGVNTRRNYYSNGNRGVDVSTNVNTTEVARNSSKSNAHFPPRGYQVKRPSTQNNHARPVNQFIEHRSSRWSSSRGRYFPKKHLSYGVPQNSRYDEPASLGER